MININKYLDKFFKWIDNETKLTTEIRRVKNAVKFHQKKLNRYRSNNNYNCCYGDNCSNYENVDYRFYHLKDKLMRVEKWLAVLLRRRGEIDDVELANEIERKY